MKMDQEKYDAALTLLQEEEGRVTTEMKEIYMYCESPCSKCMPPSEALRLRERFLQLRQALVNFAFIKERMRRVAEEEIV